MLLSSLFSEQARREARRRRGGECWGKEGVVKRRVGDGQQQQQQQQADAKGVGRGEMCSEKDDKRKTTPKAKEVVEARKERGGYVGNTWVRQISESQKKE